MLYLFLQIQEGHGLLFLFLLLVAWASVVVDTTQVQVGSVILLDTLDLLLVSNDIPIQPLQSLRVSLVLSSVVIVAVANVGELLLETSEPLFESVSVLPLSLELRPRLLTHYSKIIIYSIF